MSYESTRPRPSETSGKTVKTAVGCGTLYVTVNTDDDGFCEVFATLGKSGGCGAVMLESIARLFSIGLRSGVDPKVLINQLKGSICPSPCWDRGVNNTSCPDAIAKVVEWIVYNEE